MSPTTILLLRLARTTTTRAPKHASPLHLQTSTRQARQFQHSALLSLPRKGNEDKDSINTEATEYSKSGTDDAAAKNEEAAFDPSSTSPESERAKAGEGNEESGNPLDVSPANQEVSKPRGETEGGAERAAGPREQSGEKSSGHGSPKKAGK